MGGAPPPPLGFAPQGVSREHFFGGSGGPPAALQAASRESPEDQTLGGWGGSAHQPILPARATEGKGWPGDLEGEGCGVSGSANLPRSTRVSRARPSRYPTSGQRGMPRHGSKTEEGRAVRARHDEPFRHRLTPSAGCQRGCATRERVTLPWVSLPSRWDALPDAPDTLPHWVGPARVYPPSIGTPLDQTVTSLDQTDSSLDQTPLSGSDPPPPYPLPSG